MIALGQLVTIYPDRFASIRASMLDFLGRPFETRADHKFAALGQRDLQDAKGRDLRLIVPIQSALPDDFGEIPEHSRARLLRRRLPGLEHQSSIFFCIAALAADYQIKAFRKKGQNIIRHAEARETQTRRFFPEELLQVMHQRYLEADV